MKFLFLDLGKYLNRVYIGGLAILEFEKFDDVMYGLPLNLEYLIFQSWKSILFAFAELP